MRYLALIILITATIIAIEMGLYGCMKSIANF
jgi:hypothetical protein